MSKRVIVVVEVLLGILILGSAVAALSGSEKSPGLLVSVLVLVVIFFGILRRLAKTP
ncbi:MAG: hypothetical protein M3Y58_19000 [Chloroflexota bacterium]|nr:hypothetical protein [Chloroflexota bacterium]